MKVAIAGTGQVSTFLVQAFTSSGHDTIILTRREPSKPLGAPHRVTDYTVPSLVTALSDRKALISTVVSYEDFSINTPIHLAMLQAVIDSKTCKIFIPSEFTSNALSYPDQPMFMRSHAEALHLKLREAKQEHGVRFAITCNSWFMDYVVPEKNRGLKDVGPAWPLDFAKREMTVYGNGEAEISYVTVGDMARGLARVFEKLDRGAELDEYLFFEGQRLSWNELFETVNAKQSGGGEWTKKTKQLSQTVDELVEAEKKGDFIGILVGQFEILAWSGASLLPEREVEEQKKKYFEGVKFRTVAEVLDQVNADGNVVV